MNDTGQLALGKELGPLVKFFPEFRKIDSLKSVVDVTFGATTCHVLTQASEGCRTQMHAVGENECGQFGNGTQLQSWEFKEIVTVQSFTQISAGAFHMLATDRENKLYGWGKMNQGQLGERPKPGTNKIQLTPKHIPMPAPVAKIQGGSLFSVALV